MRYAFLPIAGDPFIFQYWLKFYDANIADRIDQLFVGQYGPASPQGIEIIQELCANRGIKFKSISDVERWGAGESLEAAYDLLETPGLSTDKILLIENDCFVFDGSIIDSMFNSLHDLSLVGSSRVQAVTDIVVGSPEKKDNRICNALWPCFLFTHSHFFDEAYKDMQIYMDAVEYPDKSRYNPDVIFNNRRGSEESVSFTFLLQEYTKSLQREIVQIRGNHYLVPGKTIEQAPEAKWVHFGSLEGLSLPGNILRDEKNISLVATSLHNNKPLNEHPSGHLQHEMYLGMYAACVMSSNWLFNTMHDRHLESVMRAAEMFKMDKSKIEEYAKIFQGWAP